MSTLTRTAEQTARLMQLHSDVCDLCDELNSLQERASRRLDEKESEFQDVEWLDVQEEMFARLNKLVTKV